MSSRITNQLPKRLLTVLENGGPALLLTIGEDGFPTTAYTWAMAINATTLRFAADHESATESNLQRERRATLQIISRENLIFLIKGTTVPVKAQIEATPFKMRLMALEVLEVKDQTWPGVSVLPLAYEWSPEQKAQMLAMEQAVYQEMRAA